jgi:hypothetical protein
MTISTSAKYYHSNMTGAPVLSGTAGALIAVLDACLVNGFGLKAVDTLTVAAGVATATIGLGIGALEADTVALISGATPAALNGQKRLLSADTVTNTVTFDATGISDQTATGSISIKLAPAGWEKQHAGTNKAAYRSTNPASTLAVLRVDDAAAQNARVVGFDGMTDIDTGTGQFPSSVQQSGGLYWPKSDAADATSRAWTVVADDQTLYLHTHTAAANQGVCGVILSFGDYSSLMHIDPLPALITGMSSDIASSSVAATDDLAHATGSLIYLAQNYSGTTTSIQATTQPESYWDGVLTSWSGYQAATCLPAYPNPADNGLVLTRKLLMEPGSLRGAMRGLGFSLQNCHAALPWQTKILGASVHYAINSGSPAYSVASITAVMFDITGPWS